LVPVAAAVAQVVQERHRLSHRGASMSRGSTQGRALHRWRCPAAATTERPGRRVGCTPQRPAMLPQGSRCAGQPPRGSWGRMASSLALNRSIDISVATII
jgi:hypothetical protein